MIQVAGPHEAEKNACVWIKSVLPDITENCLHAIPGWLVNLTILALILVGVVWFLLPEQTRAKLKISGPFLSPDHTGHDRWRIRAKNCGPSTADNVRMRLININPRPRYPRWQADFPYEVERVGKAIIDPPSRLNKGDVEDFEFRTWRGGDGSIYTSLDTKDTPPLYRLAIEPDEIWKLDYELTASNAKRKVFSAKVFVRNGNAIVEKEK